MKSKAVYKPLCLVKKRRLQAKMPQFVVFNHRQGVFRKPPCVRMAAARYCPPSVP